MKKQKKLIGIVSVGRTDYSYFKPVLNEINLSRKLDYFLIVTGMHLAPEFGLTYKEITNDGFHIDEKIRLDVSLNTAEGAVNTMAAVTLGMTPILNRNILDLLVVLGDRYETLGAVTAALLYSVPIAHIFGGDTTEGAFDNQIRHAITKMAHIHFPSNRLSAANIIGMGEEAWRVHNVGSSSIDILKQTKLYSRSEFYKMYGLDASRKLFLVTLHPTTLEVEDTEIHADNLIRALRPRDENIIITYPNSDPGSGVIIEYFKEFAQQNRNVQFVKNMGIKGYYSAMKYSSVMIGNSSSGIIEAASFKLPVINIGNRQKNRLAGENIIYSSYSSHDIVKKIKFALSESSKNSFKNLKNPYENRNTSRKIVNILRHVLFKKTKKELITKRSSYLSER